MANIDEFGIENFRSLLEEGKSYNQIMQEIMKVGSKIVEKVGHKDYGSMDEAMEDIKNHSSPLFYIDKEVVTNFDNVGTNFIGVKKCPFGNLMKTMGETQGNDQKVKTILHNFQIREGEKNTFIDLGCYVAQQLRQMILSSLTVNGEYVLNYIHLGCKRDGKTVLNESEIEAIGLDQEKVRELLEQVECVYAISYKEGMEE